ncbi:MAG: L,D-transpeptidase [Ilumatobacteraceae bacterium]|nr:L,D-transpeptidase [Ilumatobacteraceae bacterium]
MRRHVVRSVAVVLITTLTLAAACESVAADITTTTTTTTVATDQGSTTTSTPASTTTTPSAASTTTTTTKKATPPKAPSRKSIISTIVVDLSDQTTVVYDKNGAVLKRFDVSTGLESSTPLGSFKVFSKSSRTFYTPRPEEKMRWMTRFTKGRRGGNIGFHGIPYKVTKQGEVAFPTPLGVAPSSHGCVRMLETEAKWIYTHSDIGTVVKVQN